MLKHATRKAGTIEAGKSDCEPENLQPEPSTSDRDFITEKELLEKIPVSRRTVSAG